MADVTASGNEITDASRAVNTGGDGRTNDSSFGIWEATTNMVANGGFETNLTGWAVYGTATVARVTDQAKFGTASVRALDAENGYGVYMTPEIVSTASTIYTLSAWVYAVAGVTVRFHLQEFTSGGAFLGTSQLDVVPNGTWTKGVVTRTLGATGEKVAAFFLNESGSTKTFHVDGVQIEQQPISTPYVHTDGGSAARAAGRIRIPASLVDETQGWVAARLRLGWTNTTDPSGNPVLFDWRDDANNLLQARFDTTADLWELQRRNTGGTNEVTKADTFTLGDAATVVCAWDATNLKLSVDGSAFTSVAAANIPTLIAATVDVGSNAGTSEHVDSDVFWLATGTGTLTDGDAATIHGFGTTDPGFNSFPGTPTMFWNANTVTYATVGEARTLLLLGIG